jgi:MFS family permease
MNIMDIMNDSLRYPVSDWKKFLIFGILIVFTNMFGITSLFTDDLTLAFGSLVIGFIIGFLAKGYFFRIIKSSLTSEDELPEFNAWGGMFKDGIKVLLVGLVYVIIPVFFILILAFFVLEIFGDMILNLGGTLSTSATFGFGLEFLVIILILYVILMVPVTLVAMANMARNDSKLNAAFRFHEIFSKIREMGWKNLILWYITVGIPFLVLLVIDIGLGLLLNLIILKLCFLLISVITATYIYIYVARSLGLIYNAHVDRDKLDKKIISVGIIGVIGIMGMILVVLMVPFAPITESYGGTAVSENMTILIIPDETTIPVVTDLKNGSYQVTGLMRSYADSDYINVGIRVMGYDLNGNEITEKEGLIAKIKSNETSQYTVILTPKKGEVVSSADGTVLNGTVV